jgi:6-phosphogluconolactonase (cycloisomerase 2 family)
MERKAALYASVGADLTQYAIDMDEVSLARRATVNLPANVQYVWPHPTQPFLYVASSPRGPGGTPGNDHDLTAFRVAPDGELTQHGESVRIPHRPIHMTVDGSGRYVLTAYNEPSALSVHRIGEDGRVGDAVRQPEGLDTGFYAHQVRVLPSNRAVVLVTRGNDAAGGKAEEPGALKLFSFEDGVLRNVDSIAPNGGYGFGPRHLDFHPTQPWVYVSLERQNALQLFTLDGDRISREARFTQPLLAEPGNRRPRQLGGTIHVHPSGRYVYVANRADREVSYEGKKIFGGGENSIAVFAIDQATGEPALIQHVDPRSVHVRTFAFDPSGRIMVAASIKGIDVRDGGALRRVPVALSVFRVGDDGKLTFARKYDVETAGRYQFWMGIVPLRDEG